MVLDFVNKCSFLLHMGNVNICPWLMCKFYITCNFYEVISLQ